MKQQYIAYQLDADGIIQKQTFTSKKFAKNWCKESAKDFARKNNLEMPKFFEDGYFFHDKKNTDFRFEQL